MDPSSICHDDVVKFFADQKPGKGRIMKCLKKHAADLINCRRG
ncbi:MAG: hypothetical protein H7326_10180 [Bdellovibrionaceae bacterium]|nr:hypothetical protein [Pseudobdellovibrionaceae bacterium]